MNSFSEDTLAVGKSSQVTWMDVEVNDGDCGAKQIFRILLVDDELDVWWGPAVKELERTGYVVDTANDGASAWQAINAQHYDLLITDQKMPRLYGLDLI